MSTPKPAYTTRKNPETGEIEKVPVGSAATNQPKKRTSLLQGRNGWDFRINIDGLYVYCNMPGPELEDYINEGYARELAAKLKCDIDIVNDEEALALFLSADKTGQRDRVARNLQSQFHQRIVDECVTDWEGDDPCTAENKKLLPPPIRKTIAQRVIAAQNYGATEADFLGSV